MPSWDQNTTAGAQARTLQNGRDEPSSESRGDATPHPQPSVFRNSYWRIRGIICVRRRGVLRIVHGFGALGIICGQCRSPIQGPVLTFNDTVPVDNIEDASSTVCIA